MKERKGGNQRESALNCGFSTVMVPMMSVMEKNVCNIPRDINESRAYLTAWMVFINKHPNELNPAGSYGCYGSLAQYTSSMVYLGLVHYYIMSVAKRD